MELKDQMKGKMFTVIGEDMPQSFLEVLLPWGRIDHARWLVDRKEEVCARLVVYVCVCDKDRGWGRKWVDMDWKSLICQRRVL